MKKKMFSVLLVMAMSVAALTGCGSADKEETGIANPWTESDREGVLEATGFDMAAPEGATELSYSYMSESGLAQMRYELDDADWVYRMQMTDALTDISGLSVAWMSEEAGEVAGREAMYYAYGALNDETVDDVQMVNWYDAVTGVCYSLSATREELNGMDIQAYAENLYAPLQGDATDDPEKDRENELNEYFLGEHQRSDDGSTVDIEDNGDGTFDVDINIVRLCSLEDGIGTFAEHKMTFEVTDPSGNPMSGVIYRDNDNSLTVKITDSTWDYLPNDELLEGFGK